ncbi:U2 snRNP complex subunit msl1 [Turnera subulata]|uniref:U2 snRNP complex subunit msl1 n=1 Tax=Turnera subulata TaxID=218843 RepID=A0A9Q0JE10_9ROSI|nr:U2 snRNP complex subunit msl1 [Turnera subulata]
MLGVRFTMLKSLRISFGSTSDLHSFISSKSYSHLSRHPNPSHVRTSYAFLNHNSHREEVKLPGCPANAGLRNLCLESSAVGQCYKEMAKRPRYSTNPIAKLSTTSSRLSLRSTVPFLSVGPAFTCRLYSSSSGGNVDKPDLPEVLGGNGVHQGSGSDAIGGGEWIDKVKDAWGSAVEAVTNTGQKAKEASDQLTPYVQGLLDSHPYLENVIVPAGSTLIGTVMAWVVMPRILRRFHRYALQTPAALLSGSTSGEQVPYEQSFLGALEDPARYLITFMAFTQIAVMVAPTTIASTYIAPAWRGAAIMSFVWFLYRWKTNVYTRALASGSLASLDREKMVALDKISSVGLFVIGTMAFAEACGVAVQSILTVGGIGGVATAFASRDILGNVLSGLSMQFSKPFSLGDTIKAGSVEGQVVDMGLTTTLLLNAEKLPVTVPNSLFSSQVIVNKSRAQWRAMVRNIPVRIDDLDKMPLISNDIKSMLKSNAKVFLEKEAPYCFLSKIESSFAELTFGCNLKHMPSAEMCGNMKETFFFDSEERKQRGVIHHRTRASITVGQDNKGTRREIGQHLAGYRQSVMPQINEILDGGGGCGFKV